jgi:hypothetical protein
MRQIDWKYLVDFLLFICIVGIVSIGLIMAFVLAEGPVKDESLKYLFGLHRHQWGDIHLYLSLAFTVVLIVHLVLEWSWIKSKTQRIFKSSWRYVLISFIPLSLGIVSLFWLLSPKYAEGYRDYGIGAAQKGPLARMDDGLPGESADSMVFSRSGEPIAVTGRMTLSEVEQATGIDALELAKRLGLPANVSLDVNLGRLRKTYGISLPEVREVVSAMLKK